MNVMKIKNIRCIIKISIFISGLVVILSPLLFCGELYPIKYVVSKQITSKNQVTYGLAYEDLNRYYKLESLKNRDVSICALGSSRVMQFKDIFFEDSFYNAGGACAGINEFEPFLKSLDKERLPKYLLVSLDEYYFNENWSGKLKNINSSFFLKYPKRKSINTLFREIWMDYKCDKLNISDLIKDKNKIGIVAKVRNDGFRKDGSYYYAASYAAAIENSSKVRPAIEDTLERIRTGTRRYEYGEEINPDALIYLKSFLQYCKENEIIVIGFLPPISSVALGEIKYRQEKYKYFFELSPTLKDIFDFYGYEYYNFSNVSSLGCSDEYFIDGFHGSSVVYLRMLKSMLLQGSILQDICDIDNLEYWDKHKKSTYTVD